MRISSCFRGPPTRKSSVTLLVGDSASALSDWPLPLPLGFGAARQPSAKRRHRRTASARACDIWPKSEREAARGALLLLPSSSSPFECSEKNAESRTPGANAARCLTFARPKAHPRPLRFFSFLAFFFFFLDDCFVPKCQSSMSCPVNLQALQAAASHQAPSPRNVGAR